MITTSRSTHGPFPLAAILCAVLGVLVTAPTDAFAQAAYQGPTPYLSRADSPFETTALGFCFEDFENSKFDVPGATGNGTPIGSGGLTDSVDGDDGTIDGSGSGGHSYFSQDGNTGIIVTFDDTRTNGLPTEVGIVWTDGGANASVTFEAFDADGVSLLGPNGPNAHADASNSGTTDEDRLYGATNPTGISKIVINNPGGGIEVDHLQLNRCILCGDANGDLDVTASDALFVLAVSVGIETCDVCICDVNATGSVNVTDALAILRTAVGSGSPTSCLACEGL